MANNIAQVLLDNWHRAAREQALPESLKLPSQVGECSAVYWWDDDIPLLEYPFFDESSKPSGYVVVSTSRNIPPVLEFSLSGETLSSRLNSYVASHMARSGEFLKKITWYYFSPLDLVARAQVQGFQKEIFISVPTMASVDINDELVIRRDPTEFWSKETSESRWQALEQFKGELSSRIAIVLQHLKPVPYNQNCRPKGKEHSDSDHYCKPNCIAGCYPVAWSMFASSRKRSSEGGGDSKIWPESNCWDKGWPSYASGTSDPSQCQDVSNSIWDIHDRVETTCDGNTFDNSWRKATEYFRTEWGLNWQWGSQADVNWEQCAEHSDYTYLFFARGPWSKYLEKQIPGLSASNMGKVGHGVLCWGHWGDPMTGGPKIFVCYGWGKDFSSEGSKWIEVDGVFSDNLIVYVTRF
jgi:hypothetical protein